MSVTDRDHPVGPDAPDASDASSPDAPDASRPARPEGRLAAARTGAKVRRSEAEVARENAMGLLPEVPASLPRRRRHRVVALVSAIAALALVVTIFGGAWELARYRAEVGPQESTPASLSATQEARYEDAADAAGSTPAGTGEAPVVLAYHDIAPESDSEYVVTPQAFADQMAMLRRAGYTTLTQEEFTAYAEGDFTPPPRSAVITFDDGTSGLWTYGDKILEANGLHAVSFLITASVGENAPYYLTWEQIARMQASGRWSFGSHTAAAHVRVPLSEDSEDVGSKLTHPEFARGGVEPFEEFTDRVRADLRLSIADIEEHDLPRPTLFAWPFSEVSAAAEAGEDPRPLAFSRSEVDALFTTSFVNSGTAPRPAVREDLDAGLVERLEVFARDDADDVFDELGRMEQMPVGDFAANDADPTWLEPTTYPAPVVLDGASVGFDAPSEEDVKANWAPQATSGWTRYAVEARATDLSPRAVTAPGVDAPTTSSAGLRARVGRVGEVTARTSSTWVSVARAGETLWSGPLATPGSAATLRLEVTPEDVAVMVDGQLVVRVPAQPGDEERVITGASMPGSFGIVSQRGDDASTPLPSLEDVSVTALP